MTRLIFILVVILWTGAMGCYTQIAHQPDSSDAEQQDVERQGCCDDSLKFDLRAEPLIMKRGETLFIELTLTNTSSKTVRRCFGNGCIYGFSILTPEGKRVAPEPRMRSQNAPCLNFEPGKVVVGTMKWKWTGHGIHPGKYVVRAGFGEYGMENSAPPIEIELRR